MLFRALRRRRLRREPFPPEWNTILARRFAPWPHLTPEERNTLRERVRFFIAERYWEGCAGLELTDEMRVTIAAYASLLVLARPADEYGNVSTVLVYPDGYFATEQPPPLMGRSGIVSDGATPVLGQAYTAGPVILSWRHALHGAVSHDDGNNVILHEFAHKLDMLAGPVDGTPPMESREQAKEWAEIMQGEMEALREAIAAGVRLLIRPYAATNPAEFFAVTTELFFERPGDLRDHHPDLYRVLRRFYRQDPAEWFDRPRS